MTEETIHREGRDPAQPVEHEGSDVNVRAILVFAGALVAVAVVVHVALWLMMEYFKAQEAKLKETEFPLAASQRALRQGEAPRPQADVVIEGFDPKHQVGLLAEPARGAENTDDMRLESYGWVDRKAGIVHVPIERAMQLLEARLKEKSKGDAPKGEAK
jgi:hypothetical protein